MNGFWWNFHFLFQVINVIFIVIIIIILVDIVLIVVVDMFVVGVIFVVMSPCVIFDHDRVLVLGG